MRRFREHAAQAGLRADRRVPERKAHAATEGIRRAQRNRIEFAIRHREREVSRGWDPCAAGLIPLLLNQHGETQENDVDLTPGAAEELTCRQEVRCCLDRRADVVLRDVVQLHPSAHPLILRQAESVGHSYKAGTIDNHADRDGQRDAGPVAVASPRVIDRTHPETHASRVRDGPAWGKPMHTGQVLGRRQHGRRGVDGSRPPPVPRRQRVRRQPHEDGGVVGESRLDDVLTSELEAELQAISNERKWSQRVEE